MPCSFGQVPEDSGDVEQPGLLDGFVGSAPDEREELIRWLLDRGFGLDQIRNSLSPTIRANCLDADALTCSDMAMIHWMIQ
jgi:Adenylate cyclase regulatory domain